MSTGGWRRTLVAGSTSLNPGQYARAIGARLVPLRANCFLIVGSRGGTHRNFPGNNGSKPPLPYQPKGPPHVTSLSSSRVAEGRGRRGLAGDHQLAYVRRRPDRRGLVPGV